MRGGWVGEVVGRRAGSAQRRRAVCKRRRLALQPRDLPCCPPLACPGPRRFLQRPPQGTSDGAGAPVDAAAVDELRTAIVAGLPCVVQLMVRHGPGGAAFLAAACGCLAACQLACKPGQPPALNMPLSPACSPACAGPLCPLPLPSSSCLPPLLSTPLSTRRTTAATATPSSTTFL